MNYSYAGLCKSFRIGQHTCATMPICCDRDNGGRWPIVRAPEGMTGVVVDLGKVGPVVEFENGAIVECDVFEITGPDAPLDYAAWRELSWHARPWAWA